jgi:hypothetical protein
MSGQRTLDGDCETHFPGKTLCLDDTLSLCICFKCFFIFIRLMTATDSSKSAFCAMCDNRSRFIRLQPGHPTLKISTGRGS